MTADTHTTLTVEITEELNWFVFRFTDIDAGGQTRTCAEAIEEARHIASAWLDIPEHTIMIIAKEAT